MYRILFVCHGNICRSAMAEFIMKYLVSQKGLEKDFLIESAATSTEEIGNDMYPPAKAKLKSVGIPFSRRAARQIRSSDYDKYDFLIGMDRENLYYMNRCWDDKDGKIKLLLDFTDSPGEVADPWFSGNFDRAYEDIATGCRALLKSLGQE